ncbi:hypothetical protein ES708_28649 [subsurface metagenome]
MEEKDKERLKELTQKVADAGGDLFVLTLEEGRELMRLLGKRIGEDEVGYPISGEEG